MVSPTQSASGRPNSTLVWKSSPRRSAIPTQPCYAASFLSPRTSPNLSVGYYPARGYQPLAEITLRFLYQHSSYLILVETHVKYKNTMTYQQMIVAPLQIITAQQRQQQADCTQVFGGGFQLQQRQQQIVRRSSEEEEVFIHQKQPVYLERVHKCILKKFEFFYLCRFPRIIVHQDVSTSNIYA